MHLTFEDGRKHFYETMELRTDIDVIGEYQGSTNPILCKCKKHNYYWETKALTLMQGCGCPKCGIERCTKHSFKTHDEFINQIKALNPDIEILSQYTKGDAFIDCFCKKHNYSWSVKACNLLKRPRCPICSKELRVNKRTISQKDFEDKVHFYNPNIQLLSPYIKSMERIDCKCSIDGYSWTPIASSIYRGIGCPKCSQNKLSKLFKMSNSDFIERMKVLHPDFEFIEEYKGSDTHIQCICKKCNTLLNPAIASLRSNYQCPVCSKRNRKGVIIGKTDLETTHPHLVQFFVDKNDCQKYSHGSHKRVLLQCPECKMYQTNQVCIISKYGFNCQFCGGTISKPNKIIRALLKYLPVQNYSFEYSPEWAGRYRYDAYFEYKSVPYIVEMDGGFHFQSGVKGFYKEENLKNTQRRDEEKNNLAIEHGIEVIRINCSKTSIEFIKNNILNSKIGEIFDLSNINFDQLLYQDNDLLRKICDFYNSSDNKTLKCLSDQFGRSTSIIKGYLTKGTSIGLCDYDCHKNTSRFSGVLIRCYNTLTNEEIIHNSIKDTVSYLKNMGIKTSFNPVAKHSKISDNYKGFILTRI